MEKKINSASGIQGTKTETPTKDVPEEQERKWN
jgi:hypothetical protein